MKITSILLAALLATASIHAQDTLPASPAAIKNWRDARFGMFIHWGPVSLKGTEIGWSRGAQIPIEEAYAGHSSRVKKFELRKKSGDTWTTFHSGNALGSHFKATFEPVTTTAIRLEILDASEGPTISEIFLIQQP